MTSAQELCLNGFCQQETKQAEGTTMSASETKIWIPAVEFANAKRTITICKTTFGAPACFGDEPEATDEETRTYAIDDHREDFGEWNDDETEWVPASIEVTAFMLLTGTQSDFWASECTSSAAEVACGDNPFYMDEPTFHPYTGVRVEQTAHLNGFTPEEIAEIYKLVKGL